MRTRAFYQAAGSLAAVAVIGAIGWAADGPMKGRMTQMEAKPAEKPIVISRADSARWTATTYEAAASEANKKVLASGKAMTVTGEVVDVSCYLQLGKRGAAHIECGSKCISNGQPIGLVDAEDNLYILFAEEHHPRRDGKVELKDTFLPLLAKNVTVGGMMTEMKSYRALFVRAVATDQEKGGAKEREDGD
jgi:hypothetical protein